MRDNYLDFEVVALRSMETVVEKVRDRSNLYLHLFYCLMYLKILEQESWPSWKIACSNGMTTQAMAMSLRVEYLVMEMRIFRKMLLVDCRLGVLSIICDIW